MFTYCPTCRSENITTQDNHRYQCPECGFVFFHNMAATVAALICCGDDLLFTVREKDPGKGLLDLPGGFVDPGETLEQALTREVDEELGLSIEHWQYFMSAANVYPYAGIEYHTSDAVFVARLDHKPQLVLEVSEISQALWLPKNAVDLDKMAFSSLRKAVAEFRKE